MDTDQIAKPLMGSKLYQERARKAFPILVRQARAAKVISYENLAIELEMPNPRNLNYPLGAIGQTLNNLSEYWKEEIPSLQALVVLKSSGLPGPGVSWYADRFVTYEDMSEKDKLAVFDLEKNLASKYPKWNKVLDAVGLSPVGQPFDEQIDAATNLSGGGESNAHKILKTYVSLNPELLGLPSRVAPGAIEYPLPSGDLLDVQFHHKGELTGVEVKSSISGTGDIVRGLYQCVKYEAVLEAMQVAAGKRKNARTVLVLEGNFPISLIGLKNVLGIEVIENIKPVI
jgi:hypothetical protein